MSDDNKRPLIERLRDLIPFFTSMLMIAGISFTYYTYFFDIHKTPQIVVDCTLSKIDETQSYYIIKISMKLKNQSKSRVEIVGNQCKLYALRCRLLENNQGELDFMDKVMDTMNLSERNADITTFGVNKYLECSDNEFMAFFQPLGNATWFLPEETAAWEFVSAIPKTFDKIILQTRMDYSLKEDDIMVKYEKDSSGEINYKILVMEEKNDSTKTHELDQFGDRDKNVISKNTIIDLNIGSQLWLSDKDAVKNLSK